MFRILTAVCAVQFCFVFSASADSNEGVSKYKRLFSRFVFVPTVDRSVRIPKALDIKNPAKNTFVFFANAASDHWVPRVSTVGEKSDAHQFYGNAVLDDIEHIRIDAVSCNECNVVLVAVQPPLNSLVNRDSTSKSATILWVYSRGRLIVRRVVQPVNAADSNLVAELLKFADDLFPRTQLHLVYRGHSFFPSFPKELTRAFDIRHPDSPYGLTQFTQSLRDFSKKLSSITFSGCNMAYLEVADTIAKFSDFMIAVQVGVLETLDVGFRYSFLRDARDSDGALEVSQRIGKKLLASFEETKNIDEALMEYPVTVFNLQDWKDFKDLWSQLQSYNPFKENIVNVHVTKLVSDRYVDYLKSKGTPPQKILKFIQKVRVFSADEKEVDLSWYLEFLNYAATPHIQAVARELATEIKQRITLFNKPTHSTKGGMSFQLR